MTHFWIITRLDASYLQHFLSEILMVLLKCEDTRKIHGTLPSISQNGWGTTYPNPMVGCVIVKDGKIIAEGWHHHTGGPHAEAHAIMQAKADELKGATLYVNLEPCNHIGRTGACAPLVASHGITTVVIGCVDSNKKVNGSGIDYLKGQGLKVITGVLEQKAQALNKRFFAFTEIKDHTWS